MAIITCKHLDSFLDDYLAGRLGRFKRWQFKVHLFLCPPCKRYLDQYRRCVDAAKRTSTVTDKCAPLPSELADSIARCMAKHRAESSTKQD